MDKQDIELHLVKAQELRRLKTLRKKWFALYEDPDSPIDPERKRVDHRKTRRRRPDVEEGRELDETDILGVVGVDHDVDNANDDVSLPARLEYYDSEKKWREGAAPKKRIILKDCFDINRKKETANQFVITVYTFSEGLDILFENNQVRAFCLFERRLERAWKCCRPKEEGLAMGQGSNGKETHLSSMVSCYGTATGVSSENAKARAPGSFL